jgi:UDP-N-acetyl-D-glucosamine dehydrogenase
LSEALNKFRKSINGSKILILGMSYKKNIDDLRESPSLKLMDILHEKGATVDYNDPYIPELWHTRKYQFNYKSVNLIPENLQRYDAILISTDHSDYDWDLIVEHSKIIVDTRNATVNVKNNRNKIFKA